MGAEGVTHLPSLFSIAFQALREEIVRIKASLADANHRMNQLQAFRASVARLLHLRDLPEADLLHRLQTLCSAHQEFTLLSHKYEGASPVPTPCPPRGSDHHHHHGLPSGRNGRRSVSPGQSLRRFEDFHDEPFEDEFDFGKKY